VGSEKTIAARRVAAVLGVRGEGRKTLASSLLPSLPLRRLRRGIEPPTAAAPPRPVAAFHRKRCHEFYGVKPHWLCHHSEVLPWPSYRRVRLYYDHIAVSIRTLDVGSHLGPWVSQRGLYPANPFGTLLRPDLSRQPAVRVRLGGLEADMPAGLRWEPNLAAENIRDRAGAVESVELQLV
jgi:hypothetical protein